MRFLLTITLYATITLFLSCTTSTLHRVTGPHGVELYVPRGTSSAKEFFQNHRVKVGSIIHTPNDLLDAGSLMLHYPSVNDGPSPMYSHTISIRIPKDMTVSLQKVRDARQLVVVEEKADHSGWILRGIVTPLAEDSFSMDWFQDKEIYSFQPDPLRLSTDTE